MLPKNKRIPRKEFSYILKNGKRLNSPHFLLYIAKSHKDTDLSRFSFSISKKILKNAVDRNKHRRRGYAAVKNMIDSVKSSYFFFFSYKKGAYPLKFSIIESEIRNLLKDYLL
jgi:ribonuclease P protein component